jgi:hypothetical protein
VVSFKKAAPKLPRSLTHSVTEGQANSASANSASGIGEDVVIAGGVEEFQRAREGGGDATGDQKRASAEKEKGPPRAVPFLFLSDLYLQLLEKQLQAELDVARAARAEYGIVTLHIGRRAGTTELARRARIQSPRIRSGDCEIGAVK